MIHPLLEGQLSILIVINVPQDELKDLIAPTNFLIQREEDSLNLKSRWEMERKGGTRKAAARLWSENLGKSKETMQRRRS